MKPLSMLAVCVMLLSSCATKQDAEQSQQLSEASPPGIPGLTKKAVTDRIRREMVTSDGWDSARRHMTMTSYADGLDFNVTIRGPRPEGADAIMEDMKKLGPVAMARLDSLQATSPIDTVVAELRANPELGDVVDSQSLLAELAAVPYDGADPDRAVSWLREVWMQPESRTTIGAVEFILRAPSKHERVLILRLAD